MRHMEFLFFAASAIAGICIWSYSTFVTTAVYEKNNQQFLALVESNKRDQAAQMELIRVSISESDKRSELWSDRNRERMEALFNNLRDDMKRRPH